MYLVCFDKYSNYSWLGTTAKFIMTSFEFGNGLFLTANPISKFLIPVLLLLKLLTHYLIQSYSPDPKYGALAFKQFTPKISLVILLNVSHIIL